jgi:hypothetical protein
MTVVQNDGDRPDGLQSVAFQSGITIDSPVSSAADAVIKVGEGQQLDLVNDLFIAAPLVRGNPPRNVAYQVERR